MIICKTCIVRNSKITYFSPFFLHVKESKESHIHEVQRKIKLLFFTITFSIKCRNPKSCKAIIKTSRKKKQTIFNKSSKTIKIAKKNCTKVDDKMHEHPRIDLDSLDIIKIKSKSAFLRGQDFTTLSFPSK